MKIFIMAVLVVFLISFHSVAANKLAKNNFGFGYGQGYSTLGMRYDRQVFNAFYLSSSIGFGFTVGARYTVNAAASNHYITLSSYYGNVYRPYSDMGTFNRAVSVGLDYEYYFEKNSSFEVGTHYVSFTENPDDGADDGFRGSIGLNHKF